MTRQITSINNPISNPNPNPISNPISNPNSIGIFTSYSSSRTSITVHADTLQTAG